MRRFQQVKDSGSTVKLKWDSGDGQDKMTTTFSSKDRPLKDFTDALGAFAAPTLAALGIVASGEVEVRSVSVKLDDEAELSRVHVHIVKKVEDSNRPLNLNSPELELENFPQFVPLIDALHEEAEEYFCRRKREQRDAFEDAEEGAEEEEPVAV